MDMFFNLTVDYSNLFKALVWVLDKAREVYGVRLTFLVIEVRKQSSNAV